MEIEFKEVQRFKQWWLWLIMIGITILPLWALYEQIIMGNPIGDQPTSNTEIIVTNCITVGLVVLIYSMKLKTEIDAHEIRMKFFPFVSKSIQWEDIKSAEVLNYGFVGGWGIRYWTKYGTVYNTCGKIGLALELKSGKKLLIGTQKERELGAVVAKNFKKPNEA